MTIDEGIIIMSDEYMDRRLMKDRVDYEDFFTERIPLGCEGARRT